MSGFFRTRPDGVDLFVRLTPKSSADAVGGLGSGADGKAFLKARVRAVPEKGLANAALERLVADRLGVPAGCVCVAAGAASRLKTVRVGGDPDLIAARLRALAAAD